MIDGIASVTVSRLAGPPLGCWDASERPRGLFRTRARSPPIVAVGYSRDGVALVRFGSMHGTTVKVSRRSFPTSRLSFVLGESCTSVFAFAYK